MTGAADPAGRKPVSKTVFLERQGYRQRRMMDLARLLPVTGAATPSPTLVAMLKLAL